MAPRLEEGLYVGHHERTGSVICLTTAGAYFGFAVKRTEETAKWQKANLATMKGLPWEMKPPTEKQPGVALQSVQKNLRKRRCRHHPLRREFAYGM